METEGSSCVYNLHEKDVNVRRAVQTGITFVCKPQLDTRHTSTQSDVAESSSFSNPSGGDNN